MLETLKENKWMFFVEGLLLILLGAMAVAVPQLTTFSIGLVISLTIIVAGIVSIYQAFMLKEEREALWPFILKGVIGILAGILMFKHLDKGVYIITMLLTLYFGFEGIVKIIAAKIMKDVKHADWLSISGIISITLALLIMSGLPDTSSWLLGLLFGINLIATGISAILVGIGIGKLEGAEKGTPPE